MAKDIKKASDWKCYYNSGSYGSPTWAEVKSFTDFDLDPNPEDIEVPQRGGPTGHLLGEDDPQISLEVTEDVGNSSVTAVIAAWAAKTRVHLAFARGSIATTGVKYWHGEFLLKGGLASALGNRSIYNFNPLLDANSDNGLVLATAS